MSICTFYYILHKIYIFKMIFDPVSMENAAIRCISGTPENKFRGIFYNKKNIVEQKFKVIFDFPMNHIYRYKI